MKSVGEVMAIGRNFQESFQKALRGLEIGIDGLSSPKKSFQSEREYRDNIKNELRNTNPDRVLYIAEAFRAGISIDEIYEFCKIDFWFLSQIEDLIKYESKIRQKNINEICPDFMLSIKRKGFSDSFIANILEIIQ